MNKKLISGRKDLTQGWEFWKGKKKKKKRSYCNTGYSNLVTQPSRNPAERGLSLLSGRTFIRYEDGKARRKRLWTRAIFAGPVVSPNTKMLFVKDGDVNNLSSVKAIHKSNDIL